MNKINIFNETNEKIEELKEVKKLLTYAAKQENLKNIEFNVIIVDDDYIHELNKNYRNKDRVTDVITFALEDTEDVDIDIRVLGDVYISLYQAKRQAIEYGHSFLREIAFLSVHGFYHLLGYDHMTKEEEKIMFGKQEEVLQEFGIKKEV